ncbi:DUF993 family protein, partial [Acinetobacter baumannii]|nr:DUF993 family protein [Acinetobacter baumannii]
MKILLPLHNGNLEQYELKYAEAPFASPVKGSMNRIAYAAAHVVVNPTQPGNPWDETISIDWDKTLAFREYLW